MARKKAIKPAKAELNTLLSSEDKSLAPLVPIARKLVKEQLHSPKRDRADDVLYASFLSTCIIPGYATLVADFIDSIQQVSAIVSAYVTRTSIRRPLNFVIIAPPGSGKSQLAKSIAMLVGHELLQFVSFNMAATQSNEDFAHAINAARNVVVEGRIPLVLIDEFDSDIKNYAALLPVLWDGEIVVDGRLLKLERTIYLLAGSSRSLPDDVQKAQDMGNSHQPSEPSKLIDLFSRINGSVIEIPKLEDCDRTMLAMSMLRKRFPKCETVPWALIQFISECDFRYEARSISTIIDLLALQIASPSSCEMITLEEVSKLPFQSTELLAKSTMAFHLLHKKSASGVRDVWNKCRDSNFEQSIRKIGLSEISGNASPAQVAEFSALVAYLWERQNGDA